MNLDADDLLARIKRDYPTEYQLANLSLIVDMQQTLIEDQAAEIERLNTLQGAYDPSTPRPYLETEARHG
ncbi:hypothetical protein [Paractinoplanes maris]|uniref:hypothetical protein n=1 Tax=Paractinoplanes maris TaxID=1734446 RepID=UPI002020E815|nr:hypothetical protein [Actinoplanes maris]